MGQIRIYMLEGEKDEGEQKCNSTNLDYYLNHGNSGDEKSIMIQV